MIEFKLNKQTQKFKGDPDMPLLWFLREQAGLKGTKFGCGIAQCGACTVHLDGAAVRACSLPMRAVAGRRITTIEGLAGGTTLHRVQRAWVQENVPQCGYCQPGMIMAAASLLDRVAHPTDADIDRRVTNVCRCGTYQRVRRAIHRAAKTAK